MLLSRSVQKLAPLDVLAGETFLSTLDLDMQSGGLKGVLEGTCEL